MGEQKWGKAKAAAGRYGVSVRTIRKWQAQGFPHVRIEGIVLIDYERGDKCLRDKYTPEQKPDQGAKLIDELIKGL